MKRELTVKLNPSGVSSHITFGAYIRDGMIWMKRGEVKQGMATMTDAWEWIEVSLPNDGRICNVTLGYEADPENIICPHLAYTNGEMKKEKRAD